MKVTFAQHAAPLLMTTMLIAAPAWAQTSTTPADTGTNAPTTAAPAPSGTTHKAAPHGGRSAMARQPGETRQSLVERRITELHSKLQITPQQSQQWDQFAQVMRDNAREMDQVYQQRAEKLTSMTAVDNMQSYAQIEQQRAQEAQRLLPAFQQLYSVLSDQQKKTADQLFRHQGERRQAAAAAK